VFIIANAALAGLAASAVGVDTNTADDMRARAAFCVQWNQNAVDAISILFTNGERHACVRSNFDFEPAPMSRRDQKQALGSSALASRIDRHVM